MPGQRNSPTTSRESCATTGSKVSGNPLLPPLTFEEFAIKEYERDRDGNWLDIIPDGDDHSIDAVRYAVMDDVWRG